MKVEPGKGGGGSAGENEGRLAMDIELDISPKVRWEEFVSLLVLFPLGRVQRQHTLLWLRWLSVIVETAHLIPLCASDARVAVVSEEDAGRSRQSESSEKPWWRWRSLVVVDVVKAEVVGCGGLLVDVALIAVGVVVLQAWSEMVAFVRLLEPSGHCRRWNY